MQERELAFICYGFPPSVGAVGTAALLNVERSFENVLIKLHESGQYVGAVSSTSEKRLGMEIWMALILLQPLSCSQERTLSQVGCKKRRMS